MTKTTKSNARSKRDKQLRTIYTSTPRETVQFYCAAKLHDSNYIRHSETYKRIICTKCSAKFGSLYDREWTRAEINQLVRDYKLASKCLCGGSACGENANKVYKKLYPMFESLFI